MTTTAGWENYTLSTFNQTLLANSTELCNLDICPLELDGYVLAQIKYIPNLAGNVLYVAIFALLLAAQLFLGIRYRTWGFLVGMFGGGILEVIGYVARIQMHYNPFPDGPFIMYLCCLTIGPAFFTASIYLCLSRIITVYTPKAARLKPQVYTYLFITFDFVALVLQAVGGAIASTADTHTTSQQGIHLMVAGVAWQVASLFIFSILCLDFFLRVRRISSDSYNPHFSHLRSTKQHKYFIWALTLATFFILVRSIFRCAELEEGFDGDLANDEVTFMVLEGAMIILANSLLTVWHPGWVWGHGTWKGSSWGKGKKDMELQSHDMSSESGDLYNKREGSL
ncbi:putative rta1 domain [Phaeomoniella chlamydospora]|uniref:Putative rta1 domain n=1 Tax=Phaeomoniella chlamydospora TaxID=158046 RepID=A0A0G2H3V7_PHACM|nr:putative rta1 domain [Phaeomoniella chlamydospora]